MERRIGFTLPSQLELETIVAVLWAEGWMQASEPGASVGRSRWRPWSGPPSLDLDGEPSGDRSLDLGQRHSGSGHGRAAGAVRDVGDPALVLVGPAQVVVAVRNPHDRH